MRVFPDKLSQSLGENLNQLKKKIHLIIGKIFVGI